MKRYAISLIIACITLSIAPQYANAEDFHIEVNPSILIFDSANLEKTVTIKNLGSTAIDLQPALYVIKDAGNKNGSITIENPEKQTLSLDEIVSLRENQQDVSTLHLDSLESRQISIIYHPGKNTDKQYFTLVFNKKPTIVEAEDESSYSEIIPGTGILLLENSAPEAGLQTEIVRFKSKQFTTSGPLTFEVQLRNDGDQLQIVSPTISIRNILNQNVGEIEFPTQYLLPHSERILQQNGQNPTWNDSFILGPYRATLQIKNDETKIEQTNTVFVIPLIPLALTSFIIFFCLGVYVKARRK